MKYKTNGFEAGTTERSRKACDIATLRAQPLSATRCANVEKREFDEPLPPSLPFRNGKGGARKNSAFCSPLRHGEG